MPHLRFRILGYVAFGPSSLTKIVATNYRNFCKFYDASSNNKNKAIASATNFDATTVIKALNNW